MKLEVGTIGYFKNFKFLPKSNAPGANAPNYFVGMCLGHITKGSPGLITPLLIHRQLARAGFVSLDIIREAVGDVVCEVVIEHLLKKYPLDGDKTAKEMLQFTNPPPEEKKEEGQEVSAPVEN